MRTTCGGRERLSLHRPLGGSGKGLAGGRSSLTAEKKRLHCGRQQGTRARQGQSWSRWIRYRSTLQTSAIIRRRVKRSGAQTLTGYRVIQSVFATSCPHPAAVTCVTMSCHGYDASGASKNFTNKTRAGRFAVIIQIMLRLRRA
jgi:hypothetical protein